MFYVNNDDMEELFRQAAANYPLKTVGTADWEKISASLREEADKALADAGNFKKEKKRRIFFWWILLLPLGWIGHESWQKLSGDKRQQIALSREPHLQQILPAGQTNKKSVPKTSLPINTSLANVSVSTDRKSNQASTTQNEINTLDKTIAGTSKLNAEKFLDVKRTNENSSVRHIEKNKTTTENNYNKNRGPKNNLVSENTDKTTYDLKAKNNLSSDNTGEKENAIVKTPKNNSSGIVQEKTDETSKTQPVSNLNAQSNKKENALPIALGNAKQAKTTTLIRKDFHFYAGLIVGGDISTIKFQSVKGMGYSVGLLLGYHLSHSRFNIETGLYWDAKKYYTNGEYFSKKNVPYFYNNPNVEVNYVNGICNMFEIPINVRYNIRQTKSTSLFAVLGLSSYLMNKEDYSYELTANSVSWPSDVSYYHSTKNWFSIMNLSAGYEHRLGKIGDIRIEPYAKLPLSGIGKGSLSIMSMGLNVGISRRF